MLDKLPEFEQAWNSALRRENFENLKVSNVCIVHFRDKEMELLRKLPNGDGTITKIPGGKFKLKDDTVPFYFIVAHLIILNH